jgi:hypothetical protein
MACEPASLNVKRPCQGNSAPLTVQAVEHAVKQAARDLNGQTVQPMKEAAKDAIKHPGDAAAGFLQTAAGMAPAIGGLATELQAGAKVLEGAADGVGDGLTLFRGVASDSPGYRNALNGIATPIGGDAGMLEHSLGNTASNFTSWTTDYDVALKFATNKGTTNGAILTNTFAPGAAIQASPGVEAIMGESEFLVPGPVSGASVRGVP